MKQINKTNILAVVFLFLFCFSIKAQDNYEYAIISYVPPGGGTGMPGLYVSISGNEFKKHEVNTEKGKSVMDYSFVLNFIQDMANNGWRVINTYSLGMSINFMLERKKN